MSNNYSIQVIKQASEEDLNFIGLSLKDYNQSIIGEQTYHQLKVIILDNHGSIIAGAIGDIIWGWCCLEQFWISPTHRTVDLQQQLLHLVQNEVLKANITKIHTKAIYDYDIDFYKTNYYQIFASLEDRPPGYTCYYFKNENFTTQPISYLDQFTYVQGNQVSEGQVNELITQINNEYDQILGSIPFKFIHVFSKDETNNIIGGLKGYIGWGWFYISTLWVADTYRRQKLGTKILTKGEEYVRTLGINKAFLGTTEFQAREFYEKNGYQIFGSMNDLPPGYKNFMMRKNL